MRVDKFLAKNNFGSRSDVKRIIKKKLVSINDLVITDSSRHVDLDKDIVKVQDQIIDYKKDVYYMLNKPSGYISSHDEGQYPSVLELIHDDRNDLIFVGRLDVDTEGLLLITNDGKFSHQVAHGKKEVYKQYYAELEKTFDQTFIAQLEAGIPMDDTILKPARLEMVNENTILLSIAEGKYHQVKRMMHYCDNEVTYLKRLKIGDLELDKNLQVGEYRELSQNEITQFTNK